MDLVAKEQLNRKYKPSAWNPDLSPDEVIMNFLKIAEESKRESREIPHQLNVPYGDRVGMAYDVYGTNLPDDSPIFAFIHGGYWQMLSRDESTFCVKPLVQAGCRVILIGYDLCPTVTLEDILDEIQVALTVILTQARENKSPGVILGGHSAGASCAISMLIKDRIKKIPHLDLLKALYLFGGVYDLSEARHTEEANKDNLLGITDENLKKVSPLLDDYEDLEDVDTRICVIVGEHDAEEFVRQGQLLFAKLTAQGANTEIVEAKSLDHFDIVTKLREDDCFLTKTIVNRCSALKNRVLS